MTVKPKTCIRKTRADQRDRDGHHRDQHRAEGAEEEEDDDHDDQQRLAEGLEHLVDGVRDVVGGVVGDAGLESGRAGPSGWTAISARTRLMTSSELALGSGQMPMKTAVWPEKWTSAS